MHSGKNQKGTADTRAEKHAAECRKLVGDPLAEIAAAVRIEAEGID